LVLNQSVFIIASSCSNEKVIKSGLRHRKSEIHIYIFRDFSKTEF